VEGVQPGSLNKFSILFEELVKKAHESFPEESIDEAKASTAKTIIYEEHLVPGIGELATTRILNFGKIISSAEWARQICEVKPHRVRELFGYLHPQKSFNMWVLPPGICPPKGYPLYRLEQASVDALKEGLLPREIQTAEMNLA
jgi:hypothetical protein